MAVKVDVTHLEDVEKMVEAAVQRFGKIDILVNNAGIARDKLILRMTEEDWDAVLNVNLKGTFNCTKAVIKYMSKQRSGKIVNIASVVGMMGNPGQANYSARRRGSSVLRRPSHVSSRREGSTSMPSLQDIFRLR